MVHGEFAVSGDCHTHLVRHFLVWGQGSGRYLRSIDGDWGILWAAGRYYRQGDP